ASGQPYIQEVRHLRGGVWRRDEDAEEDMKHPAGIIVLKNYKGQEADCFHTPSLRMDVLEWST
ncbi:hypothetical protein ABVT39_015692, partial [Epinephelus coioides]